MGVLVELVTQVLKKTTFLALFVTVLIIFAATPLWVDSPIPTSNVSKTSSLGIAGRTPYANGFEPVGIADYGVLKPYNTTEATGIAEIYSLTLGKNYASPSNPTLIGGSAGGLQLDAVMYTGVNHYYFLQNELQITQMSHNYFVLSLIDNVWNISSYPSKLDSSSVSGLGSLLLTQNGTFYSYQINDFVGTSAPIGFQPTISVGYSGGKASVRFAATVTQGNLQQSVLSETFDLVTLADSGLNAPVLVVGGTNPVNYNLLQLVFTGPYDGVATQVLGVNAYLELYYSVSGALTPVSEASSYGADETETVTGAKVFPVLNQTRSTNQTAPIVLVSSSLYGFSQLWPLNETFISVSTSQPTFLKLNSTEFFTLPSTFDFPVSSGPAVLEDNITINPQTGSQVEAQITAPTIIQPTPYIRALFTNWLNGDKSSTITATISKPTSFEPSYLKQYSVSVDYEASYSSPSYRESVPLSNYVEWIDAGKSVKLSFAQVVAVTASSRFTLEFLATNNTELKVTTLTLNVTQPITVYATYVQQFLVTFNGNYSKYFRQEAGWYNASTPLQLSLPLIIPLGTTSRLSYVYSMVNTQKIYTSSFTYNLVAPLNITPYYEEQFIVNFTGPYLQYFVNQSGWYNDGSYYSANLPSVINVSSSEMLIFSYLTVNNLKSNQTRLLVPVNSSILIDATYTPQYLVIVKAPGTDIKGFYPEGAQLQVSAPAQINNPLLPSLFEGWFGTLNSSAQDLSLSVTKPITVHAVYVKTYLNLYILFTLIALVAVVAFATIKRG